MIDHLPFWWHFDIFRWQDGIEIILLSGLLYYLSLWLSQDTQKPLVLALYGYCTALLVADYAQLTTISTLLLLFLPILCAIFVLLHQETLQKNSISLHAITPTQHASQDWIETIMRAALSAASNNKPFTCIIEKTESLETVLAGYQYLDAPLSQELLHVIRSSSAYAPDQMLWISSAGKCTALNAVWHKTAVTEWLSQEVQEQEPWLRDALFFTKKTDALFVHLIPETRTFTVIAQGKILHKALAQHVFTTIRTYLGYTPSTLQGDWHGTSYQKKSSQQIQS